MKGDTYPRNILEWLHPVGEERGVLKWLEWMAFLVACGRKDCRMETGMTEDLEKSIRRLIGHRKNFLTLWDLQDNWWWWWWRYRVSTVDVPESPIASGARGPWQQQRCDSLHCYEEWVGSAPPSVIVFSWDRAITISSPNWKSHCEGPGTTQEINLSML